MKRIILITLIFVLSFNIYGQKKLLNDQATLDIIHTAINSIYNHDFTKTENYISLVKKDYISHPVVPFLEGLKIYNEEFPLSLENPESEKFIASMIECIDKAEKMLEYDKNDLEAVFFDLFGRAFFVMFWADNGKTTKVFPHLNTLYKNTLKGFEFQKIFPEFYFTSGLYNYYVKAYPEVYPTYKPIAMLFTEGNKALGLEQLKYCSENTVFVRVEAKLFLCLIWLNYEKNLEKASVYASELYREFPTNPFYTGKYLEILLYNKKFFLAPALLKRLEENKSEFSQMQAHLYRGIYQEKYEKNYEAALSNYMKALELSEDYGLITSSYNGIAYMGLGRLHERMGDSGLAGKYFKKAKSSTSYTYVLNDR